MKHRVFILILIFSMIFFLFASSAQSFPQSNITLPTDTMILESGELNIILDITILSPEVSPGGTLLAKIHLYKTGEEERLDFIITETITDENDTIIYQKQETVAIDTSISYFEQISIPKDTKSGKYYFTVYVAHEEHYIKEIEPFQIKSKEIQENVLILLLILIVLVIIAYLIYRKFKNMERLILSIKKRRGRIKWS